MRVPLILVISGAMLLALGAIVAYSLIPQRRAEHPKPSDEVIAAEATAQINAALAQVSESPAEDEDEALGQGSDAGPDFSTSQPTASPAPNVLASSAPPNLETRQAAVTAASTIARAVTSRSAHISIPLAFVEHPPTLNFNPRQQAALNSLAQQFVADIGGPNQNPADSTYAQRWQDAQPTSDQLYQAWFGDAAYAALQMQRYLAAHANGQ